MAASQWARRLGAPLIDLGFDPRRLRALADLPRFLRDRRRFLQAGGRIDATMPMLSDRLADAGAARGHYFHQDLLVAGYVHAAAPEQHIDVGSRIDGFVAHVAAFRRIEVMDVRPLRCDHPRIGFIQRDLMAGGAALDGLADSVSCLHALEHFGLGRYGDAIDPQGHRKGLTSLMRMVRPGGRLYVGVPIGRPAVNFNAERVFSPTDIPAWTSKEFDLVRFDRIDDDGDLHRDQEPAASPPMTYGCGVYTLEKRA
jgi:hypothetical protein